MEHNKMTFDELWELEEHLGLQKRMQKDYPSWLRRRRTHRMAMVSVAVLAVAGGAIFNTQFSIPKRYDNVLCNRATFPERHWADVAANILVTPTL
ncbi:MAG: hypothetical protein K6F85_06490 [Bacteroidales bacterium]|nr:hypothetical protein [Bacteroidales bacterium]